MEKITTKDYNGNLATQDSLSKVRAVDTVGNDILVASDIIAASGGCGTLKGDLEQDKWYRIAIGGIGSDISTAIINIGKYYNNGTPTSQLFYVSACGFGIGRTVIQLAKSGYNSISKIRIIHKASTAERVMLDIYVASTRSNTFLLSYSNNISFSFQKFEEVSADIPDGYSVNEFTF